MWQFQGQDPETKPDKNRKGILNVAETEYHFSFPIEIIQKLQGSPDFWTTEETADKHPTRPSVRK